jgi:capsular exopolysaccharide synthesis family protein
MELIQQALDKAKKQRDAAKEAQQNEVAAEAPKSESIATDEIAYTQTQNVEISKNELLQNRVVAAIQSDPRGDVYKILRTKVLQRMRARGSTVLAVTSPISGAGKSLTAANLAISIAMDANYSVLLVDLDLRHPEIHNYFGLSPEYGLGDYFNGDQSISDLLIHPGLESLVILPAGRSLDRSSDLLSTPKMLELANELKHRYPDRIVVVDLPPLLQTDDALMFMPNVDACLLVVAEGENTTEEVQRSIELIDETKFLGTVLNKSVEENAPQYY